MWIAIAVAAALLFTVAAISAVCFYIPFIRRKDGNTEEYPMPQGEIYEPFYGSMKEWQMRVREMPCQKLEIKAYDGLTLRGKYYEYSPDAPIEIMLHGYRGSSKSDLSGGVLRCFELKRSVITVDNRAGGESDGRVITFGAKESRDCLAWIDYVVKNINKDARIYLTGISMGASTVMIASGMELPENVVGVIADCGYSSTDKIIKKVMRDMKLPVWLVYPFIKLGARLYGGFDICKPSPVESLKRAKVPIIFFHGDADDFVPYEMSVENYNACASRKRLVTVKGAGHGLACPMDIPAYIKEIKDFFGE